MIRVKRVYEQARPEDGFRVLVDKLWPRGLTKAQARADAWLKDVAPSDALRKWFKHDPARWPEFKRRYFDELAKKKAVTDALLQRSGQGRVTLLFGAKDAEHNNAAALQEFLLTKYQ